MVGYPTGDLREASRGSAALTGIARVSGAVNGVIQEKAVLNDPIPEVAAVGPILNCCCCCCCCVSHSAYWLPTRKKILYKVVNPARGLLNREKRTKKKVWQRPPPPIAARSEKKIKKKRDASTCLGLTQASVRLASVQGFLRLVGWVNGCRFAKFHASVCD